MVDTGGIQLAEKGEADDMLSAADAIRELGITKMTLYKWMLQKKIRVKRYKFGSRTVLAISPDEIKRVKALMVKKRKPGKPLL